MDSGRTAMYRFLVTIVILVVSSTATAKGCSKNEINCDNGECIRKDLWCNGEEDCEDGSDEGYCKKASWYYPDPNGCEKKHFICDDGRCVPFEVVCDSYPDCEDESDENECVYVGKDYDFEFELTPATVYPESHNINPVTEPSASECGTTSDAFAPGCQTPRPDIGTTSGCQTTTVAIDIPDCHTTQATVTTSGCPTTPADDTTPGCPTTPAADTTPGCPTTTAATVITPRCPVKTSTTPATTTGCSTTTTTEIPTTTTTTASTTTTGCPTTTTTTPQCDKTTTPATTTNSACPESTSTTPFPPITAPPPCYTTTTTEPPCPFRSTTRISSKPRCPTGPTKKPKVRTEITTTTTDTPDDPTRKPLGRKSTGCPGQKTTVRSKTIPTESQPNNCPFHKPTECPFKKPAECPPNKPIKGSKSSPTKCTGNKPTKSPEKSTPTKCPRNQSPRCPGNKFPACPDENQQPGYNGKKLPEQAPGCPDGNTPTKCPGNPSTKCPGNTPPECPGNSPTKCPGNTPTKCPGIKQHKCPEAETSEGSDVECPTSSENTTPGCSENESSECIVNKLFTRRITAPTRFAFETDYTAVYGSEYNRAKEAAEGWILRQMDPYYGWGKDSPRALVALSLVSNSFLPGFRENNLMKKRFEVELGAQLRHNVRSLKMSRLAMYINAMLATCQNPLNFHGIDVAELLRSRVIQNEERPNQRRFVSPIVYVALCLSDKELPTGEFQTLIEFLNPPLEKANEQTRDMQIYSIMAVSCYLQNDAFRSLYGEMFHLPMAEAISSLFRRLGPDGSFGSKYTTGLAAQALHSVRLSDYSYSVWNYQETLDMLIKSQKSDGSFGDLLATYFILPALSGRSLLHLRNMECDPPITDRDLTPQEILDFNGPKHYINYYLNFDYPLEFYHSISLHVPIGINFYDVMRVAAYLDQKFKFLYEETEDGLYVFSISNIPNDSERGYHWKLYVKEKSSSSLEILSNCEIFTGDIRNYIPKETENMVFWYHPATAPCE